MEGILGEASSPQRVLSLFRHLDYFQMCLIPLIWLWGCFGSRWLTDIWRQWSKYHLGKPSRREGAVGVSSRINWFKNLKKRKKDEWRFWWNGRPDCLSFRKRAIWITCPPAVLPFCRGNQVIRCISMDSSLFKRWLVWNSSGNLFLLFLLVPDLAICLISTTRERLKKKKKAEEVSQSRLIKAITTND